MARIFITGSSTGLGLKAGQLLAEKGHGVVLHARNEAREADARNALPAAEAIVIGDLETLAGAKGVGEAVNALGPFDAVIHNAGVYDRTFLETADGLPRMFAVNVLAPYILTAMIARPKRLVYLSSSMHAVPAHLDDVFWKDRRWNGTAAYSESKLHDTLLAFAVARLWPDVCANAVDPGWVPTNMGGRSAPDSLTDGAATQAALAAPQEGSPLADFTGEYLCKLTVRTPDRQSRDLALQDRLLDICEGLSGFRIEPSAS
ncbi:NAD(P)-dependent dehydrogenase (short-subunit alcohol dehydrogenase family) [Rhodobium orientis]|uniref:Short-chain dehydrogenase n=1 Tax=Rhodobium orientis TaxID=34017 RepID=A0A327JII3_9HYPH|nr:SDR family NAD(P)-dependent oxidoreductase [Rhodobium orientis]MBB4301363.1 NAD(P)-dependent dehydrogenase (short-subunit alcohol dehydrogenase family) [Rhodobium orientis]MBK5951050.1 short-chain dehydrogenase [Rhodobium orientis]RAI24632.1 short-chain dehydrogenase [Rhodobium orientis]